MKHPLQERANAKLAALGSTRLGDVEGLVAGLRSRVEQLEREIVLNSQLDMQEFQINVNEGLALLLVLAHKLDLDLLVGFERWLDQPAETR